MATDDNAIRCMRFACWITRATHTQTQEIFEKDAQCTYNVTLKSLQVTIVAAKTQLSITYSQCVFVALLIQHAKRMCRIKRLFHEPEILWFKWTYFQARALVFPQRRCQGHGAANAGSGGFVPRCWVGGSVTSRAVSTSGCTTHCSSGKLLYCRLDHNF